MGHVNIPAPGKRGGAGGQRQWRLLDLVTAALFLAVFVFFALVFTPLGDPLAAAGRRDLALAVGGGGAEPRCQLRIVVMADGGEAVPPLDLCPAEAVDHMPCEDPRRTSQLSLEMNFYRERHC